MSVRKQRNCITDVPGIFVGHWTDTVGFTGCTVILTPKGAVAGCDVRGGAASTRGTDVLAPLNLVECAHAIVLTGGSAFGLDCISGVTEFLEKKRIGFDVGVTKIPIVAGAVIFDLAIGSSLARPDKVAGMRACEAASHQPSSQGNVGAGTGATVGKLFGIERAMKGGLGCASIRAEGGVIVGSLVVVNAFGDVRNWRTGKFIAAPRSHRGNRLLSTVDQMKRGYVRRRFGKPATRHTNTTLAVVATNARLNKVQATKIAQVAHDGLALAISPVHTMFDGDVTFALSTGRIQSDVTLVGALAVECVADAIVNAMLHARSLQGIPAHRDLSR